VAPVVAPLATYRPLFVRGTEPICDELKGLAPALGEPGDAEVMRERLEVMLAEEPRKSSAARDTSRRTRRCGPSTRRPETNAGGEAADTGDNEFVLEWSSASKKKRRRWLSE